jgi:patatin-related protein
VTRRPVPPAFAPEQELRVAVVLYGGVSLAIYMYGVVEELFNLVRATAPSSSYAPQGDPPADLAFPEVSGTAAVYRELGRILPLDGSDDGPVRTRFVVDIISGTSAGGINGICLAKALATEGDLGPLKNVWLKEGDIGHLINDERSETFAAPPQSLLSGTQMLRRLVDAIGGMTPGHDPPSRFVDELDLWVTATDLAGLELPIQIANATPTERRHANRYHFRYTADGDNDLGHDTDGFLAYAARSTSAFPFAFQPALLEDLGGLVEMPDDAWERFYTAYASTPDPRYTKRAFSDGGILDNKPFSYATQSLVGRHASIPVTRKLLYVEPDPVEPGAGRQRERERERWGVVDTTQAALLGLPHVENIRADIQAVLARNREIQRVREVVSQLGDRPGDRARLRELARTPTTDAWRALSADDAIAARQWGPAYGAYHAIKVRGVVDHLAGLVVRAAGFDPDSDEAFAVRYVVRAWKETRFARDETGEGSENAFLHDFDMPYRHRRLDFVLRRITELRTARPEEVGPLLARCDIEDDGLARRSDFTAVLDDLRRETAGVRRALALAERELVRPGGDFARALRDLGLDRRKLLEVLNARDDDAMLDGARELVDAERFDNVAGAVRTALVDASKIAREAVDGILPPRPLDAPVPESGGGAPVPNDTRPVLQRALRFTYDAFEAYDVPLLMLQFGTPIGETNPVDIVRVSPADAGGPAGTRSPLKGLGLHHFAAFLDERWRAHDMLWGRLDGAECLIRALLPRDDPRVEPLVRAAHDAILADFRAEQGAGAGDPAQDDRTWFRDTYRVDATPAEDATSESLLRAGVVTTDLLLDTMRGRRAPAALREVVAGWRTALVRGDPDEAVAALTGVVTRQPLWAAACAAWLVLVVVGLILAIVTDGVWAVLGGVLIGVALALEAIVCAVRLALGRGLRTAFGAVRHAAFSALFPRPPANPGPPANRGRDADRGRDAR